MIHLPPPLPLVAITISGFCERILLICYFLMICTVVVTKEKEFFGFLCVLFLVAVRVLFDELGGIRRSCRFLFVCEDCVRFLWVCAVVKVHGLCEFVVGAAGSLFTVHQSTLSPSSTCRSTTITTTHWSREQSLYQK